MSLSLADLEHGGHILRRQQGHRVAYVVMLHHEEVDHISDNENLRTIGQLEVYPGEALDGMAE